MRNLMREIPWAAKRVLRRPGFFILATALLAVGTGAALLVASLYDQVVLQRLPVARPEELVLVNVMSVSDAGDARAVGQLSSNYCKEMRRAAADSIDLSCFALGETVVGFTPGA